MLVFRVFFVVVLGLLVAFGMMGHALAASHQAAGQEKKAEKPAPPAVRRHVGTVKAVDPAAGTVTVTETEGDATVSVTGKTTIKKGKESLKVSDLKVGDEVTVRYAREGGKDLARDVTVK